MKRHNALSLLCTVIFLIGIVAAFFGFLNQGNLVLSYTLVVVSLIYLTLGWYIFRGYHPDGHSLLLFLFSYMYASVFMAIAFISAGWPLAKTFVAIGIIWSVIQIVMVTVIRKKLPKEGFVQLLIEGSLMLLMTIAILIHLL